MTILYPEEMRTIDQVTISGGRNLLALMERAGCRSVELANQKWGLPSKAVVFCGPGNNGGDGMVIARELAMKKIPTWVFFLHGFRKTSQAFIHQLIDIQKLPISWSFIQTEGAIDDCSGFPDLDFLSSFSSSDWIIDAIYGTGSKKSTSRVLSHLFLYLNQLNAKRISIDQPTGIDGTNGQLLGKTAFQADMTICIGYAKTGLLLYPGRAFVGDLQIADIGFDDQVVLSAIANPKNWISEDDMNKRLPKRIPWGHKGSFGRVLVTGGSNRYKGAPILAATGAMAVGTGLVFVQTTPPIDQLMISNYPQWITIPYHEPVDWTEMDSWVIGMGMMASDETHRLCSQALMNESLPLVLDAYALEWLSEDPTRGSLLKKRRVPAVLTPHDQEFAQLIRKDVSYLAHNRVETGKRFARENNAILILKGPTTIIFSPEGSTYWITIGNTGLAKGGSGDVLSGMVGGFLAQKISPVDAAICGTYLHARSSDRYSQANWEGSFQPTDIASWIGFKNP